MAPLWCLIFLSLVGECLAAVGEVRCVEQPGGGECLACESSASREKCFCIPKNSNFSPLGARTSGGAEITKCCKDGCVWNGGGDTCHNYVNTVQTSEDIMQKGEAPKYFQSWKKERCPEWDSIHAIPSNGGKEMNDRVWWCTTDKEFYPLSILFLPTSPIWTPPPQQN